MGFLSSDHRGVKSINPGTWPQYPFNDPPSIPEQSRPLYSIDESETRIPMRDGIRLAADVYRPSAYGLKFPALIATSPYSRHIQRTTLPHGQNEAGVTQFWVPRGYAHIIVDVRGTNDSEGSWDMMGPTEQRDLYDLIEWVAEQPWCDGNVGMTGTSYFGWSQMNAATQQPPHLKTIFAYEASTDLYRDVFFHGGILSSDFATSWFGALNILNLRGGHVEDPSGIRKHCQNILGLEFPFDGSYYQERLSWQRLDRINIPVYFGCGWPYSHHHLRGAFEGWERVTNVPKRMFIGPPVFPPRPMGAFHVEALRWYDHHLKGMDTGVFEGSPVQLWINGLERWRSEDEWPLARIQWRELFLAGGNDQADGKLLDSPGADSSTSYNYDPASHEARFGKPELVYRSEALEQELEITGPMALYLWASSSATDTDWLVTFNDESPDGQVRELCRGYLRASHREVDKKLSKPHKPYHPHTKSDPLEPGEAYEFAIEIWPTANLFGEGHRIRLEIASSDNRTGYYRSHETLAIAAKNTVLAGRAHPSRLLLPVVPPK